MCIAKYIINKQPCSWTWLFVFILIFKSNSTISQTQNHWVVPNLARSQYIIDTADTTDFGFDFDFNKEPPLVKVIHNVPGGNIEMRSFTCSDYTGNLNLYCDETLSFLNAKNQKLNEYEPSFAGTGQNVAYMFPTTNDSIILIVYREDSLYKNLQSLGEVIVKYSLYHIYNKNFITFNSEVDFKNPYFNHFHWLYKDYSRKSSFQLFKQFIDEKSGNYYLFFNIGDSVFTSRYSPSGKSFSLPFFSGMNCQRDIKRNTIPFEWIQGEDFTINQARNKAVYINSSTRDNFPELLDWNNSALMLFDFNYKTGKFSKEELVESFGTPNVVIRYALSSSDTILYLIGVWKTLGDEVTVLKYVFDKNYKLLKKYEIKAPPADGATFLSDIRLAPNGKIYISLAHGVGSDTTLLVIENPNDVGTTIKFSNRTSIFGKTKIRSKTVQLGNFPTTYGSYKRADFSSKYACKTMGIELTNNSDTFWFKHFRFYLGNGDSLDVGINQKKIRYNYTKPGKYLVKLKAFYKNGAWSWFSDTVEVLQPPSAYFTNQTSIGCQNVAFIFYDSSKVQENKPDSLIKHLWQFGDGNSLSWLTKDKTARQNQNHTYIKDGIYTVLHIVSDGYCKDTFKRLNAVQILPAPKPGIVVSPNAGCSPLKVQVSVLNSGSVDSIDWVTSNGLSNTKLQQKSTNFIFTLPGKYKVFQTQYGTTGCITKDSALIEVVRGVDTSKVSEIVTATVLGQNEIFINWLGTLYSRNYELYKNNVLLANLTDTFYIDRQVNSSIESYEYKVRAVDICNKKTGLSNIGSTLLLKAEFDNKSKFCVLRWNPYLKWQNGVKYYQTIYSDNNYQIINNRSDTFFLDESFLIDGKTKKCYKVIAYEANGNNSQSESNEICVPYETIIWIPSALTINGDGLNESLKISTFGVKSFTLNIFNRWGEKIFTTTSLDEEWKPEQQGIYMYLVSIVAENQNFVTTGSITVLK